MNVTYRALAVLLIFAVVISIGGTIYSLNELNKFNRLPVGYATSVSTGIAMLNVTDFTSLKFIVDNLDFGSGAINTTGGYNNCTLYVNDTSTINKKGCIDFNNYSTNGPFLLQNDGTANVELTLNANQNATEFIGGNSSIVKFQYAVSSNGTGSCRGTLSNYDWTDVTKNETIVCTNFTHFYNSNTLIIAVKLVIPDDAFNGSRSAVFTATGTKI